MPTPRLAPSPDDKKNWSPWRDREVLRLYRAYAAYLKLEFHVFQRYFLVPPAPYRFSDLQVIQMGGAKRIGKTWMDGFAVLPYTSLDEAQVRLYGPVHELCSREFDWIKKFLFGPLAPHPEKGPREPLAFKAKWLEKDLIEFEDNPKQELRMKWKWGATIRSKSQMPNDDDWVGEPIDLGVVCEPGKFPDLVHSINDVIKPNLEDRNGLIRVAGTVDEVGQKDLHETAHNFEENPHHFCVCEIPRWANTTLFHGYTKEQLKQRILQERRNSTWKAFSVNWLGLWSVHTKNALEQWGSHLVKKISLPAYQTLLKGPPQGWIEFIGMDTGTFKAAGRYYASPQGHVLRIQEFVNYERRGGVEEVIDSRGMGAFMAKIKKAIGPRSVIVYGDPTSQFKDDIQNAGDFYFDPNQEVNNDHGVGIDNMNEYFSQGKFMIVRPKGSAPTMLELEIPRLRWKEGSFGPGAKPMLDTTSRGHTVDETRYALSSHPISPHDPSREREKSWLEKDMERILARCREDRTNVTFDDMPGMGGW